MSHTRLHWDAETHQLRFIIPPMWTADTCVLFSGREVKRVEFRSPEPGQMAVAAWDSCNGPSVASPTPVSGGYQRFENSEAVDREMVVRALHGGGVTCYMALGPATLPIPGIPEIIARTRTLGVEIATARFAIGESEAIDVVVVLRAIADAGGALRDLTESIAGDLLRERFEGGSDDGWQAVRRVA
jgi:hypothetical protein